jgi:hydrogenase nickel incorporation protein HypA/HybF
MHEASIVRTLIELILEKSFEFEKVERVSLELGELTNYHPDSIFFYFDSFKRSYDKLSNSILEIDFKEGILFCNDCNREGRVLEKFMIFCPFCNSSDVKIIKGEGFLIREIKGK